MLGWFVSLSAVGVTAWIPEEAVVLEPSATEEARLAAADLLATAVALSSGEQLVPVPLPSETAVQRYDDGTLDVVLDPSDADARLIVDGPQTAVTLQSGEQLLPVQGPLVTYAIRFDEDGTLCIDFPWGQICSPPPKRRRCSILVCGENGTRLDGLVVPVDGPATAVTLPAGERLPLR